MSHRPGPPNDSPLSLTDNAAHVLRTGGFGGRVGYLCVICQDRIHSPKSDVTP